MIRYALVPQLKHIFNTHVLLHRSGAHESVGSPVVPYAISSDSQVIVDRIFQLYDVEEMIYVATKDWSMLRYDIVSERIRSSYHDKSVIVLFSTFGEGSVAQSMTGRSWPFQDLILLWDGARGIAAPTLVGAISNHIRYGEGGDYRTIAIDFAHTEGPLNRASICRIY